ncbi:MAG: DNA replication/repair protein RecF [Anaerorhabdus sp.]
MYIKELQLRNFRNIDLCSIQFEKNYNILLGNNAQGKTNILESLVFLSSTRSHRIQDDQQMIQFEKECSNLQCTFEEETETILSAVIHQKGKTLLINKVPILKSSEFIGKLNVVLFSPNDLTMFENSPRQRRKVVDIEIGKTDLKYMTHLGKYLKLLKERNTLLKINRLKDDYMEILENQLIGEQLFILNHRQQFVNELNKTLSIYYKKLAQEEIKIECLYDSCINFSNEEKMKEDLISMFEKNREKDEISRSTGCGIHRDDFIFTLDGRRIEEVASQGQKRMVLLSFKLSLLHYIKNKTQRVPVLLLDDVMSELDEEKRKNLFQSIPKGIQTIITTTDKEDLEKEIHEQIKWFEVNQGKIKEDLRDE